MMRSRAEAEHVGPNYRRRLQRNIVGGRDDEWKERVYVV